MKTDLGRYQLADVIKDEDGYIYVDLRARLEFQESSDDILHISTEGETLHTLANRYYQGSPNPASLWWAIADYQPEPIQDPTVALAAGRIIIIPSGAAVQEAVLGLLEEDNVVV